MRVGTQKCEGMAERREEIQGAVTFCIQFDELNILVSNTHLFQQGLGGAAIRAVGFGEDGYIEEGRLAFGFLADTCSVVDFPHFFEWRNVSLRIPFILSRLYCGEKGSRWG